MNDCYCTEDCFDMIEDNGDDFSMAEALPGPGVAPGGNPGDVLKKRSEEDYDTVWGPLVAGEISYDNSLTYPNNTVGKEISQLKNAINDLGLSVIDGKLNITFEE